MTVFDEMRSELQQLDLERRRAMDTAFRAHARLDRIENRVEELAGELEIAGDRIIAARIRDLINPKLDHE